MKAPSPYRIDVGMCKNARVWQHAKGGPTVALADFYDHPGRARRSAFVAEKFVAMLERLDRQVDRAAAQAGKGKAAK